MPTSPRPPAVPPRPTRTDAEGVLRAVWGFEAFRPAQTAPLDAVLAGRDVLAVLPTGGGKSLLYQVPALLGEGLTLVVTPLVALMHDQVGRLRERRVRAAYLDHTLGQRRAEQVLVNAQHGAYRLLYVAPERFDHELWGAYGPRLPVVRLAVDEAHCVSAWGRHFRPAYRRLAAVRESLGVPQVVAVTATAPPDVRRDLLGLLGLRDPAVFVEGFGRPNLSFSVAHTGGKDRAVRDALRDRLGDGAGIVYAATRRGAEEWGTAVRRMGYPSAVYHGGLGADARKTALDAWLAGRSRVMAATPAFGLGIDKPDVRVVVHADLPAGLDAYYQEAGRAGRDGATAHAVLLVGPGDAALQQTLIARAHPSGAQAAKVLDAALNLAQIAVGAVPEGPVVVDAARVAETAGVPAALVEPALTLLERADVLTRLGGGEDAGRLQLLGSPEAFRAHAKAAPPRLGDFLDGLLRRLPPEAFAEPVPVALGALGRALRLDPERVGRGLAYLAARGLALWTPTAGRLVLDVRVARSPRLVVDDRLVREARLGAEAALAALVRYAQTPLCRHVLLLRYYGADAAPCGRCDVCRGGPPPVTPADEPALRALLAALAAGTAPPDDARTPRLLAHLVREGYVEADDVFAPVPRLTAAGRAVAPA